MKLLRDIWILADSGIVLYHRVFDTRIDVNLFGAMLTALNSFAEAWTETGISNFELADTRFTVIKESNYLFIASTDKKHSLKKIKIELENLKERFFGFYPEDLLLNWNGDTSIFFSFENRIEDSLELMVEKMEQAFW